VSDRLERLGISWTSPSVAPPTSAAKHSSHRASSSRTSRQSSNASVRGTRVCFDAALRLRRWSFRVHRAFTVSIRVRIPTELLRGVRWLQAVVWISRFPGWVEAKYGEWTGKSDATGAGARPMPDRGSLLRRPDRCRSRPRCCMVLGPIWGRVGEHLACLAERSGRRRTARWDPERRTDPCLKSRPPATLPLVGSAGLVIGQVRSYAWIRGAGGCPTSAGPVPTVITLFGGVGTARSDRPPRSGTSAVSTVVCRFKRQESRPLGLALPVRSPARQVRASLELSPDLRGVVLGLSAPLTAPRPWLLGLEQLPGVQAHIAAQSNARAVAIRLTSTKPLVPPEPARRPQMARSTGGWDIESHGRVLSPQHSREIAGLWEWRETVAPASQDSPVRRQVGLRASRGYATRSFAGKSSTNFCITRSYASRPVHAACHQPRRARTARRSSRGVIGFTVSRLRRDGSWLEGIPGVPGIVVAGASRICCIDEVPTTEGRLGRLGRPPWRRAGRSSSGKILMTHAGCADAGSRGWWGWSLVGLPARMWYGRGLSTLVLWSTGDSDPNAWSGSHSR